MNNKVNYKYYSIYNYLDDGASAKTGYSGAGVSVSLSLVGFKMTDAVAISKVTNDAYIYERGAVLVGRNAAILADSRTKAYGDVVEGYKLDLISGTSVTVKAYTQDATKASTGNYLMLLVDGSFKMDANSDAEGKAYSVSGGAVELFGTMNGFVAAGVGDYYREDPGAVIIKRGEYIESADEKNKKIRDEYGYERSDAVVGKNSYVEANTVDINVTNKATTYASLKQGKDIKFTGSAYCVVPTVVHTWSGNDVEDGAVVIARMGNANFASHGTANSKAEITNDSLGVYFTGDKRYPYNFVGQKAFVEFSNASFVLAEKDINVRADASATIKGTSSTTIKDFFSGGLAYVRNYVQRNIDIDLRDQARLA